MHSTVNILTKKNKKNKKIKLKVAYIVWDFGIILFAIDGEMKVPVALSCSSRDLAKQQNIFFKNSLQKVKISSYCSDVSFRLYKKQKQHNSSTSVKTKMASF